MSVETFKVDATQGLKSIGWDLQKAGKGKVLVRTGPGSFKHFVARYRVRDGILFTGGAASVCPDYLHARQAMPRDFREHFHRQTSLNPPTPWSQDDLHFRRKS